LARSILVILKLIARAEQRKYARFAPKVDASAELVIHCFDRMSPNSKDPQMKKRPSGTSVPDGLFN
jgi:hypothetical protein